MAHPETNLPEPPPPQIHQGSNAALVEAKCTACTMAFLSCNVSW